MKNILCLFLLSLISLSIEAEDNFFKKVFKDYSKLETIKISEPPVEDGGVNSKLIKVYNSKNKMIGYIRPVATSTGCNDGCLPVIFTLFYGPKGEFLEILSKDGLTKRNHDPFTDEDYLNLKMILTRNPLSFKSVTHPKQMVDAISSATLKIHQPDVVARAAYSTLRINIYHQHTMKVIKEGQF